MILLHSAFRTAVESYPIVYEFQLLHGCLSESARPVEQLKRERVILPRDLIEGLAAK